MMFRESVQVFICLSVLISSSVSLHMIRDAYHRPVLNELHGINRDPVVIDANNAQRMPDIAADLSMRATRNPSSNNLKYHEMFPSSLSSSSSVAASSFSSSSSSPSSSLPFSVSFRSGSLARLSGTDSDGRYRWQKQVIQIILLALSFFSFFFLCSFAFIFIEFRCCRSTFITDKAVDTLTLLKFFNVVQVDILLNQLKNNSFSFWHKVTQFCAPPFHWWHAACYKSFSNSMRFNFVNSFV